MAEAEDEDLLFGGYPASWLASGLVLGWAMLVNLVLARCFKVGQLLTFCILEQQRDISGVKDTVRNIWSNICLIGALVLTISVPLAMDTEVPKALKLQPALVSTFAMLAMLSAIQLGEVTMECIVHLIYTEALSASGTLRYLLQSQTAIGGPMLMFILGCIHCLVAMGVWAYLKYGGPVLVCGGIACLVCFLILVVIFIGANHFSPLRGEPGSSGWLWVESPSDSTHRPWWDRLMKADYSKEQLKTLQDRAKAAALLEEKQAGVPIRRSLSTTPAD